MAARAAADGRDSGNDGGCVVRDTVATMFLHGCERKMREREFMGVIRLRERGRFTRSEVIFEEISRVLMRQNL